MTLVHWNIRRLNYRAAGVMQPRRSVRKFYKILEVAQRCISTSAFKIGHEWRAVAWHQHQIVSPKGDGVFRSSCVKFEFAWGGLAKRSHQTWLELNALPIYPTACFGKQLQGKFVAAKLDSDSVENPICLLFDLGQRRIAKKLEGWNIAPIKT